MGLWNKLIRIVYLRGEVGDKFVGKVGVKLKTCSPRTDKIVSNILSDFSVYSGS